MESDPCQGTIGMTHGVGFMVLWDPPHSASCLQGIRSALLTPMFLMVIPECL